MHPKAWFEEKERKLGRMTWRWWRTWHRTHYLCLHIYVAGWYDNVSLVALYILYASLRGKRHKVKRRAAASSCRRHNRSVTKSRFLRIPPHADINYNRTCPACVLIIHTRFRQRFATRANFWVIVKTRATFHGRGNVSDRGVDESMMTAGFITPLRRGIPS